VQSWKRGCLTPISPPPVKSPDLFRPVVLGNRSAAGDVDTVAFVLSAVFVSSTGATSLTWHPTPIEALAPPKAEDAGANPHGLETQSCPRTGLSMTSDVTEVRPLSPGSGEGPRQNRTTRATERDEGGVPSNAAGCRTCGS
jgi:hypothetical protein